jgi:hypothetical protein
LHDSDGAENGALIDGRSLAHSRNGSNGSTSDLALAQLAGPLACSRVGGSGSVDNSALVFWPSTAPQHRRPFPRLLPRRRRHEHWCLDQRLFSRSLV